MPASYRHKQYIFQLSISVSQKNIQRGLQYGLPMYVHGKNIFLLHMQLELQYYLCSWCYSKCHFFAVPLILLLKFFSLFSTLFLVWLHIPGRTQSLQVSHAAPALLSFPALSAAVGQGKQVHIHPLLQHFTHSHGPFTLIFVSLSGVSPCTGTINTEPLKSDRDWKQWVSGCHLVRGGGRRGRMNEPPFPFSSGTH